MNRRVTIGACILIGSAVVVVIVFWHRMGERKAELQVVRAAWERTLMDARAIEELRSQSERVSLRARPTQDVIARIHAALAECGIPPDRFAELRNDSDTSLPSTADGNTHYRIQSLALSLRGLTVADLGGFLDSWSRANPSWTITRITLAHARKSQDPGDDKFDISVILSALYVGD
jgi:hypothetical protein